MVAQDRGATIKQVPRKRSKRSITTGDIIHICSGFSQAWITDWCRAYVVLRVALAAGYLIDRTTPHAPLGTHSLLSSSFLRKPVPSQLDMGLLSHVVSGTSSHSLYLIWSTTSSTRILANRSATRASLTPWTIATTLVRITGEFGRVRDELPWHRTTTVCLHVALKEQKLGALATTAFSPSFSHPRASDLELGRVGRLVVLDLYRLGIAAASQAGIRNEGRKNVKYYIAVALPYSNKSAQMLLKHSNCHSLKSDGSRNNGNNPWLSPQLEGVARGPKSYALTLSSNMVRDAFHVDGKSTNDTNDTNDIDYRRVGLIGRAAGKCFVFTREVRRGCWL